MHSAISSATILCIIAALLSVNDVRSADVTCAGLANCIHQHNCINVPKAAANIWDDLIVKKWDLKIDRIYNEMNFDCVLLKCSKQCVACTECAIVKDAMVEGVSKSFDLYSRLQLQEKFYKHGDVSRGYHACPKMQECINNCTPNIGTKDVSFGFMPKCLIGIAFNFGGNDCAKFGYNGDCGALFGLTKKLFIQLCGRHILHILTQNPSCEELWNKVNLYKHFDLRVPLHHSYPL